MLLLFAVAWQCAIAQTSPLQDKLNHVFANIDKSQIPTGFLEEYGVPLVPLDVFNGILSDSNKVTMDIWRQAYTTLYTSRINGYNPLDEVSFVNSDLEHFNYIDPTVVPVPMVLANYNSLRPDALSANLLYVHSDQLYDIPGRTQSPYNTSTIFAATPVANHARTGSVSIVFEPGIFYNTTGKTLSTIQIDFGDGRGYLSASWYNPITSNYTSTGTKQLKIKVTFTDNTTAECYSVMDVQELGSVAVARYTPITSIPPVIFAPTANHSGGTVSVRYSINNTTNQIQKPLIVAEGVDYSFRAPKIQGNYSFLHFINDINRPAAYDFNFQLDNLASYDLIFLDYRDGADDIVRNAALLQEVISWVNNQKAPGSPHQNVVLGISMGGLVARYALANMTKQNIPTQTRLLLTHDTPHRGANTPLGVQALTLAANDVLLVQGLHLFNIIPQVEQAEATLLAPASQQMLILRATNGTGGVTNNTFLDGAYRTMVTFSPSGPQPTYQFKATSLGSQCGIGSLAPGTELAKIEGNFFLSPIPWVRRRSFNTEIEVKALPAYGTTTQISKLRIWVNYRILSFISININLTNKTANSPAGALTWDGAPGSTQSIRAQAGSELPDFEFSFFSFLNMSISNSLADYFCFVPTVSALDIDNITQSSLYGVYANATTPPATASRAANFIAQERFRFAGNPAAQSNMIHPWFTARNAEWLFREMENPLGNNLNCTQDCGNTYYTMQGPSIVCTSQAYQIDNLPTGATVTWSASGSIAIAGSNTANPVNVTTAGNGAGVLTAMINSSCGSGTVTKNVLVGPLSRKTGNIMWNNELIAQGTSNTFYAGENICASTPYQVELAYADAYGNQAGPNSYDIWFEVDQGNGYMVSTLGNNSFEISVNNPSYIGTLQIPVRIRNQCNVVGETLYVSVYVQPCWGAYSYTISPNPAGDELVVAYDQGEEETLMEDEKAKPFAVVLYNDKGEVVRQAHNADKTNRLICNTRDLPNGTYILHITDEQETIKKQILIKHE